MTTEDAESTEEGLDAASDDVDAASQEVEGALPNQPDASARVALGPLLVKARTSWRPILLVALVISTGLLAIGLFFFLYRPDREIDNHAADQAIRAASDGAVAVLTYSSGNLERDFSDAKAHLTGAFLEYYTKFSRDVVMPAVGDKHLTQTAEVVRAGVLELHPRKAVVLVFLNETTSLPDKKLPLKTPTSVRVTMEKADGAWLISQLEPVG